MHPIPASRNRPPATTLAGLAAAALVSAVIPAAAGLAFLISLAVRQPLVAVAARHWPWLTGRQAAQPSHRTLTGLTAAWGIGLLAAAAVQGAGAITGGLAFTSPASFAARALIALAVEAILAALTITWLHHSPAPGPQARSATSDTDLPPGHERSSWQQQNRHDLTPDGR
jgi:hypothetical protein